MRAVTVGRPMRAIETVSPTVTLRFAAVCCAIRIPSLLPSIGLSCAGKSFQYVGVTPSTLPSPVVCVVLPSVLPPSLAVNEFTSA